MGTGFGKEARRLLEEDGWYRLEKKRGNRKAGLTIERRSFCAFGHLRRPAVAAAKATARHSHRAAPAARAPVQQADTPGQTRGETAGACRFLLSISSSYHPLAWPHRQERRRAPNRRREAYRDTRPTAPEAAGVPPVSW